MKLIIILFVLLLAIAVGGKFAVDYMKGGVSIPFISSMSSTQATINNQTFKLLLTKTQKEKEVGLSGRKDLPQDSGMLFEFDSTDYHSFWMKNMQFPIDIIFINNDKIVSVYTNLQPPKSTDENLVIYRPENAANKVLEINAGLAKKYNIKKGDTVTIKK